MTVYQVGKWYKVPVVRAKVGRDQRDWPVIGPKHEDAAIIKFPFYHYHIDWRFVCERDWWGRQDSRCFATVLHESGANPDHPVNPILGPPVLKRMKCKRQFPDYPLSFPAGWLQALAAAYMGCKLKPGLICPHRLLPLDSLPDDNGVVTCPGHGLKWNIHTGEMVL